MRMEKREISLLRVFEGSENLSFSIVPIARDKFMTTFQIVD